AMGGTTMMTVMATTRRHHDADVVDPRDARGHPVPLYTSVVAGTVEMGETMSRLPIVRTGRLVRCILAVLLSTVSGGMPLLGTPGLRADAQPWRSAAPSPQCGKGQLHIPRPCGTLSAVAAISPTDVWAVGRSGSRPLIEHWDGTRWSQVPDGSSHGYWLVGVAAVSPRDVWAVGMDDHSHALVEHWDGTRWRLVPTPSPGRQ